MKTERWQEIDRLLGAALDHAPDRRAAFLDESCRGDEALRLKVESLLAAHDEAGDVFLATPALEVVARTLALGETRSLVGSRLGPYEILELAGKGGMGEVYVTEDRRLRRKVALKLLPSAYTHDPERVYRFEQEAHAASMLNHPNILTIFEVGLVDGVQFIATEYVEGEQLRERIARGPLDVRDALAIAIQVASALAAAHAAGIVHRDVKPENLMVRPDGYVKVLDFGIAKLTERQTEDESEDGRHAAVTTRPGHIMGTASYMSPEQLREQPVDARSDIFSLGVVLYETVAGRRPFDCETASDAIALILKADPRPLTDFVPEVPRELEQIIGRALCKDREGRYQRIEDLLIDLEMLEHEMERPGWAPRRRSAAARAASSARAFAGATARRRTTTTIGLAVLVALLAIAGTYTLVAPLPRPIASIAVLRFANESGRQELDYLSEGVSESLIDRLSQLPQLKVTARNSAFRYTGRESDLQEVARALGVEAIVTGKVVRVGEGLAVRAELVDARDNRQIWGAQYGLVGTDLQPVEQAIARAILEKLSVHPTAAREQRAARRPTESPEAYEQYLNGLYFRRKGGPANFRVALGYYDRAIALDPKFALAIADAAWIHLRTLESDDPFEATTIAKAEATRALALDETLPQAHFVLGLVASREWEWADAQRELERAIELSPNLAGVRVGYAFYLSSMGRYAEALAEVDRARELDPLDPMVRSHKAAILYEARRYDEAIELLTTYLELEPNNSLALNRLTYVYGAKGMYAEAIAASKRLRDVEATPRANPHLAYLYLMSGRRAEALAELEGLTTTKEHLNPLDLASVKIALGDNEAAFACLERGYADRDPALQDLKGTDSLDPLRSDPRFSDLLRRVGLAP